MTETALTTLSVRGDARLAVAPDLATMYCGVRVDDRHKADATRAAAVALDAVLGALRELGGVPLTPGATPALGWMARSAGAHMEHFHEGSKSEMFERAVATAELHIEIRDFALVAGVSSALAEHRAVETDQVRWSVDADNPGWPSVRAAAIHAAIARARDYAQALGGSLLHVEHVADLGLLGTDSGGEWQSAPLRAARPAAGRAGFEAPSLDPEPQELVAYIEARCSASVAPLPQ
jgi:uncharacterized protein